MCAEPASLVGRATRESERGRQLLRHCAGGGLCRSHSTRSFEKAHVAGKLGIFLLYFFQELEVQLD